MLLQSNNIVENKTVKCTGKFERTIFPKDNTLLGLRGHNFGVTKFLAISCENNENFEGREITIVGYFSEPCNFDGNTVYTVIIKPIINEKYGLQYELKYITESVDFSSIYNQKAFLKTFLTKDQIDNFYKVYDNPLKILINHDIESLVKIHGIGYAKANKILEKFESKKDYSILYVELEQYNFTEKFIKRLIDKYKTPNKIIQVIKNDPYELVRIHGIGFKKADEIALKGGINPKSSDRIGAYIIDYLRGEAEEGNSYISVGELTTNIYNYFGGEEKIIENYYDKDGNITSNNIKEAVKKLISNNTLVVEKGDNKSRQRVYLYYYYNLEKQIAHHLKRLLHGGNHFNYRYTWKDKVKELEKEQGFNFDENQLKGIKMALDNQVCIINGCAGSGKSSLVSGILASLDNYTFAQTSLSGKAAARLQEVTGQEGKTIHRLLEYTPNEGFNRNEFNTLEEDIIIVDEISMIGGELFLSLLEAIPNGTKLIMCGDMGQLESLGTLNLAMDMIKSKVIPSVELTTIHRQAAQSGIISVGAEIRKGNMFFPNYYEGKSVYGEMKDMAIDISANKDTTLQRAINWYKKMFDSETVQKNVMNIQLLAPVKERGNASVYNLNIEAQKIVNPLKEKIENNDPILSVGTEEKPMFIQENDKIMCVKNNYSVYNIDNQMCSIYNGWTGVVEKIGEDYIRIFFPIINEHILLSYETAEDLITLGYASTTHKYQGSEVPMVIGVLDYTCPPKMLTKQWLYTMITRAKKKCILVGQNAAINKAINTNFISNKRTFLQELLLKE